MNTPGSPARLFRTLIAAALLCAAGCQQTPIQAPEPAPGASVPALPALPLPPADAERFRVNAMESDLRVIVYRGGPLAKFGHNHVLRAGDLRGDIRLAPEFARSTFSLEFSPAAFIVDPPDARAGEGPDFAAQPSPEAITGTRTNLLGPKVLDAERFPIITLRAAAVQGSQSNPILTTRVALHGVERDVSFPATLEHDGKRLVANGTLLINTTDFGIPAFTVMGGGLKVMEEVKIKFRVVAERNQ